MDEIQDENVNALVRIASAIDDCPTLLEMDAMLDEISRIPPTMLTRAIQDSMLDMRADLVLRAS